MALAVPLIALHVAVGRRAKRVAEGNVETTQEIDPTEEEMPLDLTRETSLHRGLGS